MFKKFLTVAIIMAVSLNVMAATRQAKHLTGVVNVNTATSAELTLLPGIGKAKAEAIIAQRKNAPFKSAQDLDKIKGIGPKMIAKFQQYVVVDGPTTAKLVKVQAQSASATVQKTN